MMSIAFTIGNWDVHCDVYDDRIVWRKAQNLDTDRWIDGSDIVDLIGERRLIDEAVYNYRCIQAQRVH